MTTVTIVTGNHRSGRRLVGAAVASFIRTTQGKSTYAVNSSTKLRPHNFKSTLDDLVLISSSDGIEPWMTDWIAQYGDPMFTIHITRHRDEQTDTTE